jgi:hypothetical protein
VTDTNSVSDDVSGRAPGVPESGRTGQVSGKLDDSMHCGAAPWALSAQLWDLHHTSCIT